MSLSPTSSLRFFISTIGNNIPEEDQETTELLLDMSQEERVPLEEKTFAGKEATYSSDTEEAGGFRQRGSSLSMAHREVRLLGEKASAHQKAASSSDSDETEIFVQRRPPGGNVRVSSPRPPKRLRTERGHSYTAIHPVEDSDDEPSVVPSPRSISRAPTPSSMSRLREGGVSTASSNISPFVQPENEPQAQPISRRASRRLEFGEPQQGFDDESENEIGSSPEQPEVRTRSSTITWKLIDRIIDLSEAKNWPEAIKEWRRESCEMLEHGEDSETCLCGHHPIREVWHIANERNSERAIVGSCCVLRIAEESTGSTAENWNRAHLVFAALRRLRDGESVSANEELIEYAFNQKILNLEERNFYLSVFRKRTRISDGDVERRDHLTENILLSEIYSVEQAYRRLRQAPSRSAGPKLIDRAFLENILNEEEKSFYMTIWKKALSSLSTEQRSRRAHLNSRIITNLSETFPLAEGERAGQEEPLVDPLERSYNTIRNHMQAAASRELIEWAFTVVAITGRQRTFYLNTRHHSFTNLTAKQKTYRQDLNRLIINAYTTYKNSPAYRAEHPL